MKHAKLFLALAGLAIATTAAAQEVTCENNPMKTVQFCKSEFVNTRGGYYFFATNDTGLEGRVLFAYKGLASAHRPDGIMVKLDDTAPFQVPSISLRPDVNCSRYGGCVWSISTSAAFTSEQVLAMSTAQTMLVSFVDGAYVSDPIEVDGGRIARWHAAWEATHSP